LGMYPDTSINTRERQNLISDLGSFSTGYKEMMSFVYHSVSPCFPTYTNILIMYARCYDSKLAKALNTWVYISRCRETDFKKHSLSLFNDPSNIISTGNALQGRTISILQSLCPPS
jgi:hypothetical protein